MGNNIINPTSIVIIKDGQYELRAETAEAHLSSVVLNLKDLIQYMEANLKQKGVK